MQNLNESETKLVSGGHNDGNGTDHGDEGFWYRVGEFLAKQANANEAIYQQYGNTNKNHMW
jgi:hypothetical protein